MPRRLRTARREFDRVDLDAARESMSETEKRDETARRFRTLTGLEAQQRAINVVAEHIRTRKPFRDATPKKKRGCAIYASEIIAYNARNLPATDKPPAGAAPVLSEQNASAIAA